jgi:hypothetical protein
VLCITDFGFEPFSVRPAHIFCALIVADECNTTLLGALGGFEGYFIFSRPG